MSEYIKKGYIRNADIIPIQDDMRIADIPELYAIALQGDLSMEKYERIISTIKEESPLLKMIQQGIKLEKIKEAVIASLEPYFDNKNVLEEFAIEVLIPESINLLKLQKDKWFFEMFKKCLSTYRLAKSRDLQSCFESCALWQPLATSNSSKLIEILECLTFGTK